MNTLFMHCRPGFEGEVCSEIAEHAARLNVSGYAKAKTGDEGFINVTVEQRVQVIGAVAEADNGKGFACPADCLPVHRAIPFTHIDAFSR